LAEVQEFYQFILRVGLVRASGNFDKCEMNNMVSYVRFETFMAHDVIKSSRAISRVNVVLKTNVLETNSDSIIRVCDTADRPRGFFITNMVRC
jgi:hypothetical protein